MSTDDQYVPTGEVVDNDYKSRTGQTQIPVQSDDAPVKDPIPSDGRADSDEYLAQDEKDAIDESNIISERTRGATKEAGTYAEPGDEEVSPLGSCKIPRTNNADLPLGSPWTRGWYVFRSSVAKCNYLAMGQGKRGVLRRTNLAPIIRTIYKEQI
jgi:hypothetical protein